MFALVAALAVALVGGGVTTFVLLRPGGQVAGSVTDPVPASAQAAPADGGSRIGDVRVTPTQTTSPTRASASGLIPSTASSTSPVTPFVPVPTTGMADCSAPNGVDAAGVTQTYEPAKAFDGSLETAWRCSGDATGRTLLVTFATPVQLTSVGLVPGYDKVDSTDGSDRFVQSRKITRVRWTFDDGSFVESTPNGDRRIVTTAVSVRTSSVRLTIEQTIPGSAITNNRGEALAALDSTAVSEIAFAGLR